MKKQPMLVLCLALFIVIISGGYFYYRYEKKIIRQEQYNNLKTIADLKINQILQWLDERLADAQVISEGSFIRQNFQQLLLSHDSNLGKNLLERFSLLRYNYKYEDVFVVSAGENLLLDLNANLKHIDSETIDYCKKALRDKKAFLSDFYFSPAQDTIHFDIFAPILNTRNVAVAVLVLRVNPYDYLYPLIQSWPTSSKSGETLIIRRDGESILYENELRHISNTALRLRIPLTHAEVPAVQAVLGRTGIFEGLDYRGVRVLADIRQVPGTPWFMIAKVDQSEIFSELRYRTVIVIIITLLLLLFFGIGISWLYNIRQKNIYRKLVETGTALQESQEEFRTTLYSIGDAVITTDIKGCIRNMNVVAEKLTGWKESDVVGRTILDVFNIVNEESRDKVESPVQRVLKEGFVVGLSNHTLLISKGGKDIPIADSGAPILNGKGDITGVVLVFRDQTEERAKQKALQESESKYRMLFENAEVGMYRSKIDGSALLDVNNKFIEILGFTREEMLGTAGRSLWADPEERYKMLKLLKERGGILNNYEVRVRTRNEEVRDVMASIELHSDEGYLAGTIVDITERKEADKKIKDNEEKFRSLFEKNPLGIAYNEMIFDPSGKPIDYRFLEVNEAYIKIIGLDPTGKKVTEVFPGVKKYAFDWIGTFGHVAQTGEQIYFEQFFESDNRWYGCVVYQSRKNQYAVVFQDITQRKQDEEEIKKLNSELEDRVVIRTAQLEASNKEMEAFSYSVSHDLRAPLRHVSGYVELLKKHFQSDLPEKGQHYLNSIADSVRIMGMLIDDLLQFAKTGRMEMHQSDLDMNEIVKEVIESMCKDNPDRKIEWIPGKLATINGDEAMLHLVWTNLLSNAVKFTQTRKKARIETGVRKENKELVFFVCDNGVGFDMKYAQKLFGVFQRLHPIEEFEGTGIGLANVQRIILRHGGRAWAEAEPDKGAVFYFSIPNK